MGGFGRCLETSLIGLDVVLYLLIRVFGYSEGGSKVGRSKVIRTVGCLGVMGVRASSVIRLPSSVPISWSRGMPFLLLSKSHNNADQINY